MKEPETAEELCEALLSTHIDLWAARQNEDVLRAALEAAKRNVGELADAAAESRIRRKSVEAERDEARALARALVENQVDCWSYRAELVEAYPWLMSEGAERPGHGERG